MKIINKRLVPLLALSIIAASIVYFRKNSSQETILSSKFKGKTDGMAKDNSSETFKYSRMFIRLMVFENSDIIYKLGKLLFLEVLDTDHDGWLTYDEAYSSFQFFGLSSFFEYYFKYQFGDDPMDLPMFMKNVKNIRSMEIRGIDTLINQDELNIDLTPEFDAMTNSPEDYYQYYLCLRDHLETNTDITAYHRLLSVVNKSKRRKLRFYLFFFDIISKYDEQVSLYDINTFFDYYSRFIYTQPLQIGFEKIRSYVIKEFNNIIPEFSYAITAEDIFLWIENEK